MRRVPALLAAAYVAAAAYGFSDPSLRASADAVGEGRVWTLLTSALQPEGPAQALQVLLLIVVVAWVVALEGAMTWWASALAGHVGSALVAYAVLAVFAWLGDRAADRAGDQPDFGISCVIGGSVGALLASGLAGRGGPVLWAGVLGLLVSLPLSVGWYDVEHVLSVLLGAVAAWPLVRRSGVAAWT